MTTINDYRSESDELLVSLSLEDTSYFSLLVERYEPDLLNFILRKSNISKEEAEDVLQEVFIKVYKNLNDFDTSLKFSSWIYRMASNENISNFRRKKVPHEVFIEGKIYSCLIDKLSGERKIENDELLKEIRIIINKLKGRSKEAFILKFLEEKNYEEISDIMKISDGTVGALINKARTIFKVEAKKRGLSFTE